VIASQARSSRSCSHATWSAPSTRSRGAIDLAASETRRFYELSPNARAGVLASYEMRCAPRTPQGHVVVVWGVTKPYPAQTGTRDLGSSARTRPRRRAQRRAREATGAVAADHGELGEDGFAAARGSTETGTSSGACGGARRRARRRSARWCTQGLEAWWRAIGVLDLDSALEDDPLHGARRGREGRG